MRIRNGAHSRRPIRACGRGSLLRRGLLMLLLLLLLLLLLMPCSCRLSVSVGGGWRVGARAGYTLLRRNALKTSTDRAESGCNRRIMVLGAGAG